jgi:hypothetical protein
MSAVEVVIGGTLQYPRTPSEHSLANSKPHPGGGTVFSDHLITIAGRSITITSHDMLMMLVSVVTGLLFWTALYFSRKRIVVLKRSTGTDQVTFELSRIADALERIANRPADEAIAAASRRQQHMQPPPQRESKGNAYSMFGR